MITCKFKSTDGAWFILPALGFAHDCYGFRIGLFFLLWGIELEYEKPQYKR